MNQVFMALLIFMGMVVGIACSIYLGYVIDGILKRLQDLEGREGK